MQTVPKEMLWETKYRPQTINDCVLPERVKKLFNQMIESNNMPNMLLASSSPGTGKTTVARALLADLGYEVLFINASSNRGVDLVKHDLPSFCSSVSFSGKPKAVVLDEADNLTRDAQKALRGLIEHFSKNIRFVLTCNYANQIIEPIRSRLQEFEFSYTKPEQIECIRQMMKRAVLICKNEGIPVTSGVVIKELVTRNFPDNRKTIVSLQNYARTGAIDEGILSEITASDDISLLLEALKSKNFKTIRELVPTYSGDVAGFLHTLYKKAYVELHPSSIPDFIMIVGDANNNAASCVDPEILLSYTLCQIMVECSWQ